MFNDYFKHYFIVSKKRIKKIRGILISSVFDLNKKIQWAQLLAKINKKLVSYSNN